MSGTYRIVKATNPDGTTYDGSVTIKRNGAVWDVSWRLPKQTIRGAGLLEGDSFVVGFGEASAGVMLYTPTPSGLSGRWASVGGSATGTEVLRRR